VVQFGGATRCINWWWFRIIRRTIIMDKIRKLIYDVKTDIDSNTSKYIIILGVLFLISIIL
jgi:hypothetical protein